MRKICTLSMCLLMAFSLYAETLKVSGSVLDAKTQETLIGVSVLEVGTTNGIITDLDGNFTITVQDGAKLQLSYVGYMTQEIRVTRRGDLGIIRMEPEAVALEDVTITGQMARTQQTPVAVSQVTALDIEERLGGQEFPEILKSTPGVHANGQGGGWGDSEIWMRGFDNTNVATMINGVPMNDMEGGTVYWSNWQGLSDVTSVMQTQRGMGASKVSAPSVGGTINIVTKGIDAKKGGMIMYSLGNDNSNKIAFSVSTGLRKSGWAITVLGTKTWGDGYIQGTGYSGYSYFLNVSKRINDKHQLSLTGFGAPQWHWQRPGGNSGALTLEEWNKVRKYMKDDVDYRRYNPAYGYNSRGEQTPVKNRNHYHKPHISLNHVWQIDYKSSLSTAAYVSIGRGGGAQAENSQYSTYIGKDGIERSASYNDIRGANNGVLTTDFRRPDGSFDFAAIEDINAVSETGSKYVLADQQNNHNWVGLVSTYNNKFLKGLLELTAGIDMRYYEGIHTTVITDLMGGDYFIDATRFSINAKDNKHAADPLWQNEKLTIGDIVYRDYTGYVMQEGAFGTLEYAKDGLSAFVNGSINYCNYWREDRMNYDEEHRRSGTVGFLGGTIKGGVNYNINPNHNVFVNVGYISRAPKFQAAYANSATSHALNRYAHNEQIASVELGYGFHNQFVNIAFNGYYTRWMDKVMNTSTDIRQGEKAFINMTGVGAEHMGLELEIKARPTTWLEMNAMVSLGDWKWKGQDVVGYLYDDKGNAITRDGVITTPYCTDEGKEHAWAKVDLEGIRVGGQAQTTANFGLLFKPFKGFRLGAEYTLYDRNYSYYSFNGNNLVLGKTVHIVEPYRCPIGGTLDARVSYSFEIGSVRATLAANVTNVLDQHHIEKAWSASSVTQTIAENTKDNIYFYYNKGRQWNIRLKINF